MSETPALEFIRQLRQRHVVQWTIAYLTGAWVLLEASSFLSNEFGWGQRLVLVLTIVLAFGTLSAITVAWYHGSAGGQRVTGSEAGIHCAVAAAFLAFLWIGSPLEEGHAQDDGAPPSTRVAVLYFRDNSSDQNLTPLSSDLAEAIVHRLAQVPALTVLPLTAVEPYRRSTPPYDSIIEALQAGSLVEGSLTRLGKAIVVTAQLVEGGEQVHQSSWVYRRPDSQWIAVVTDVADSISDAIRAAIGRRVAERRIEASSTVPEALAVYNEAKAILSNEAVTAWREDPQSGLALLDEAERLLERAEGLDPRWIEPTLLHMDALEARAQLMGGAGTMNRNVLRAAIDYAGRALVMASDSAPLLERRGQILLNLAEYSDAETATRLSAQAEDELRKASRLDDQRPLTWWGLSQVMRRKGNLKAAYQYALKAYDTDSFMNLTFEVLGQLVQTALDLERFDEATRWCELGRRLWPSQQTFSQWRLVLLASRPEAGPGEVETAWAYVDTLVAAAMPDRRASWTGYGQMLVGVTLATAGQRDSATAVIQRARRTLQQHGSPEMQAAGAYFEAAARLRMDQRQSAIAALRRYTREFGGRAETLAHDWWFRELWDDPRFIALYGGSPTEAVVRE